MGNGSLVDAHADRKGFSGKRRVTGGRMAKTLMKPRTGRSIRGICLLGAFILAAFGFPQGAQAVDVLDDLQVTGTISAGTTNSDAFHAFGGTGRSSEQIADDQDVFVADDLEVGGELFLSSKLYMEGALSGGEGDQFIYFFEDGLRSNEWFKWEDATDRFEVSDALQVAGNLLAGTALSAAFNAFGDTDPSSGQITNTDDVFVDDDLEVGGSLYLNSQLYMDTGEGNQAIYFYDNDFGGGTTGEYFAWNNAQRQFKLSDKLNVTGNLVAGVDASGAAGYNAFGSTSTSSGEMSTDSDVFINDDLEIGGEAYLNGTIYMKSIAATGYDGDQFIYFYNGGYRAAEFIQWDESEDAFYFTDDIMLTSPSKILTAGATSDTLALESSGVINMKIDSDNGIGADGTFRISSGAGTLLELYESGNMRIAASLTQNYSFDLAENFIKGQAMEPGDLVRIHPVRPDTVLLASEDDGDHMIGVVSEDPGFVLGGIGFTAADISDGWGAELRSRYDEEKPLLTAQVLQEHQSRTSPLLETAAQGPAPSLDPETMKSMMLQRFESENLVPVALAGRVPVKADASEAAIEVGDYLRPGPVAGFAVKAEGPGPVIGTALEPLLEGTGRVLVFVARGWYGGGEGEPLSAEKTTNESGAIVASIDPDAAQIELVLSPLEGEAAEFQVVRENGDESSQTLLRVSDDGGLHSGGTIHAPSLGLAEYHPVSAPVATGEVVVADRLKPGWIRPADSESDPAVVGIVAERSGMALGESCERASLVDPLLVEEFNSALAAGDQTLALELQGQMEQILIQNFAPVALAGTVACKADAGYGGIQVGDLLTTSPTPGHVMRSDTLQPGTIVGKALEPLYEGQGTITVLIFFR